MNNNKNGNHKNGNKTHLPESEKVLDILKAIESNPQVTQRGLSEKCDISLGKVNFIINALVNKGVIKVQNFKNSKNKLAYMYLFTSYGIKTKIELTRQFMEWKIQQYERLKKEIESYKNETAVTKESPAEVKI